MKKEKFNLFMEIDFRPLRIYNRVVMSFNLLDDFGHDVLQDYLSCFSISEKKEMREMTKLVQLKGKDYVMKMVTRNLPLEEEDDDE